MSRAVLAPMVLAVFPLGSLAEESAVRLKVQAMAAPQPALKYQLLPEVRELKPGNPVQWYLRCFQEQRNFFFRKESVAERARYLSMPLAELPADKLRNYGGSALSQADWAARLDTPDWQVLERVQTDGADLLLPELEPLQVLALALQVRFRAEVAGRHFDDAIRTAKTMFALARHLGEHPTTTANLAGLGVANLTLDTLIEMVQQPGCPNLYWALTDLPYPLVDLRKGMQGDRTLTEADLRPIRSDVPMTEAQIEKVVSRLSGVMGFPREQAGLAPRSLRAGVEARAKAPEQVRAAGKRLVEAGSSESLIKKFSPAQVILLDEKRVYEIQRDEGLKLLGLAPWQIALTRDEKAERGGDALFADLLPRVIKARWTQGRLEQRIALLRHIEALRLYTAEHGGKLPEKLADVALPLAVDPFSGKPFVYNMEAGVAHLQGSPPRGEEKNPDFNIRYALTIQQ